MLPHTHHPPGSATTTSATAALAAVARGKLQQQQPATPAAPTEETASKQAQKAQIKAQLANRRRAKGHFSFMSRYGLDPNAFAPDK